LASKKNYYLKLIKKLRLIKLNQSKNNDLYLLSLMVNNKVKQIFHSSLVNKIKYNNIHSLLLNMNGKITLKSIYIYILGFILDFNLEVF